MSVKKVNGEENKKWKILLLLTMYYSV